MVIVKIVSFPCTCTYYVDVLPCVYISEVHCCGFLTFLDNRTYQNQYLSCSDCEEMNTCSNMFNIIPLFVCVYFQLMYNLLKNYHLSKLYIYG